MDDYVRLSELSRKERRELNRIVRQQRRMKAPCMNCEKRHFNCHGTCPDYQEFRMERDRKSEEKALMISSTPEPSKTMVRKIWKRRMGR